MHKKKIYCKKSFIVIRNVNFRICRPEKYLLFIFQIKEHNSLKKKYIYIYDIVHFPSSSHYCLSPYHKKDFQLNLTSMKHLIA